MKAIKRWYGIHHYICQGTSRITDEVMLSNIQYTLMQHTREEPMGIYTVQRWYQTLDRWGSVENTRRCSSEENLGNRHEDWRDCDSILILLILTTASWPPSLLEWTLQWPPELFCFQELTVHSTIAKNLFGDTREDIKDSVSKSSFKRSFKAPALH